MEAAAATHPPTQQAAMVLRAASGLIAFVAVFTLDSTMGRTSSVQGLLIYQFGVVLVSVMALSLTFEPHFQDYWHVEAAFYFSTLLAICAGTAFVTSEPSPLLILAIAVPIATVLLPWSWRFQFGISTLSFLLAALAGRFMGAAPGQFFWIALAAEFSVGVLAALMLEREREQQELYCAALEADEEQFRSLIENSPDGLTVVNGNGTIAMTGPSVERLLGYNPKSLLRRSVFEFLHHDDVAEIRAALTDSSERPDRVFSMNVRCRHADGSWRTIEAVSRRLDFGREPLFVFNWRDVTDRALQELRLKESEQKFRRVFQNSTDVISITSAVDGKYVDVNDEFVKTSGYTQAEVVGKTSLEIGRWADPQDYVRFATDFLVHGEIRNRPTEFRAKDGTVSKGLLSAIKLEIGGNPMVLAIISGLKPASGETISPED